MYRYVTMKETWILHYILKFKRSSVEWRAANESRPKQIKTQQSAGKVMASVFWEAHGILLIECFEKGKTITSTYHTWLLDRLNKEIKKKQS